MVLPVVRTSKLDRGPKRGFWVCQKRDHYAHEQHTPEEVAAAKKTGKLVLAYAATLSERRGFQVQAAWAGEFQSSTETSDSDIEVLRMKPTSPMYQTRMLRMSSMYLWTLIFSTVKQPALLWTRLLCTQLLRP
jgi:hypothetical protein